MRTMIWKELRENFKWAALALLALTVEEFYTLSAERGNELDVYNNLTICSSSFLLVTSFGCAAIGAALGVVQILPELRRDQWAALLHRPVTRGVIFFGKVAAGLLLYFFATALPFLATVAYAATPGQFPAPLVPGMTLPALSDIFLGLVFYSAALLVCLQRGRWFGSRGLVGLSVLPIFVLHSSTAFPFLLPLLASAVYLLAAWGTMLSNGRLHDRPWIAKFAFILIVVGGAQAVGSFFFDGLILLPWKSAPSAATYTRFEVTQDGQVFLSTQHGELQTVVTDMNGKVVTDERYVGNNNYQNFIQLEPLSYSSQTMNMEKYYLRANPRNLRNYVTPLQNDYQSKETWYMLVRENYLIGYDKLSRRCVGICDADGFKPAGATPRPFPQPIQNAIIFFQKPLIFWVGTQLYTIDFPERTLAKPFNAQSDVISGAMPLIDFQNPEKPARIAVALSKSIQVIDLQGKQLATIPYGHDLALAPILAMGANADLSRYYVQYSSDFYNGLSSANPDLPVFLDESDGQGNVLHSYSHRTDALTLPSVGWIGLMSQYSSPIVPTIPEIIYHEFAPANSFAGYGEDGSTYPPRDFVLRTIGILLGVAVVLSIITWMWARRIGFSTERARLWTILVFCFGLWGLIAFRLASDWPRKVRCPQCGRLRPLESEECPHCHKLWPPVPATGIEIFDLEKAGAY
jgi:ABC-type transport system involved in multi-copper enzyme maturation permease subunit